MRERLRTSGVDDSMICNILFAQTGFADALASVGYNGSVTQVNGGDVIRDSDLQAPTVTMKNFDNYHSANC
jgi:hypothetical protein